MSLHDAREPAALAGGNHIHKLFAFEDIHQHLVASLGAVLSFAVNHDGHLAQETHRRQTILSEMSLHRLRQPGFLYELNQSDLCGVVAVLGYGLALSNHAWAGLQHRDWVNITLVIEELRHANLLAENSTDCHFLVLNSASWSGVSCTGGPRHGSFVFTAVYLCSLPNALISTSTPAGSSSFMSASTVCCVGSRMSSRRL